MDTADGTHNFLCTDKYESIIGKRDDRIINHISALLETAIAEHDRGVDALSTEEPYTRTFAAREYLSTLIDEYVIAVLGNGVTILDTIGTPYCDLPAVLHDQEITAILAKRDEIRGRLATVEMRTEEIRVAEENTEEYDDLDDANFAIRVQKSVHQSLLDVITREREMYSRKSAEADVFRWQASLRNLKLRSIKALIETIAGHTETDDERVTEILSIIDREEPV